MSLLPGVTPPADTQQRTAGGRTLQAAAEGPGRDVFSPGAGPTGKARRSTHPAGRPRCTAADPSAAETRRHRPRSDRIESHPA